jgi:tripartite ATP-independent transporter DctM subunit
MIDLGPGLATIALFGLLMVFLVLGVPFAFAIGGTAIILTYFLWGVGGLNIVTSQTMGLMQSTVLLALPMFYLMATLLERSGIADRLYELMYVVMGRIRGGLAAGTVFVCMIFAAMAGISGAATVSMALIALPSMLKRGYSKQIAIGSIAAGGALGILIPPSVTMIVYGVLAEVSVGRLFAGGILPGMLLGSLYMTYILVRSRFQPWLGPVIPMEERITVRKILPEFKALILPIALMMMVLGSIFSGMATPTEAAAVGAFGAILCAAVTNSLSWSFLNHSVRESLRLTSMVLWIALGAVWFSSLYAAVGGSAFINSFIGSLDVSPWVVLICIQLLLFVLGMVMETNGIIFITVPILVPIIKSLGFDPVWFGIVFIMNMEMGLLTPPFGLNLFYIKGVAPKSISMSDIWGSVGPFVLLQGIGLITVMVFPHIVTAIPDMLFGGPPGGR